MKTKSKPSTQKSQSGAISAHKAMAMGKNATAAQKNIVTSGPKSKF